MILSESCSDCSVIITTNRFGGSFCCVIMALVIFASLCYHKFTLDFGGVIMQDIKTFFDGIADVISSFFVSILFFLFNR